MRDNIPTADDTHPLQIILWYTQRHKWSPIYLHDQRTHCSWNPWEQCLCSEYHWPWWPDEGTQFHLYPSTSTQCTTLDLMAADIMDACIMAQCKKIFGPLLDPNLVRAKVRKSSYSNFSLALSHLGEPSRAPCQLHALLILQIRPSRPRYLIQSLHQESR